MTSLIVNRIKFHAPAPEVEYVDFDKVIKEGVDATLPVFYFDKPLSKVLAKCFYNAQKCINFNLVMPSPQKFDKKLNVIYSSCSEVKKLSVNYKSGFEFKKLPQEDFISLDGCRLDKVLSDYFLDGNLSLNGVRLFSREYVLSGHNIYLELSNCTDSVKTAKVEVNLSLGEGYFSFIKKSRSIEIVNLFTLEKEYFNFSSLKNKFCFSCVDSLQNSRFARINLTMLVELKPFMRKQFYFNLGKFKFNLISREEESTFENLAYQKNSQKFDVKIESLDRDLQYRFNNILPQKIYRAWLNRNCDKKSENEYCALKESFIKKDGNSFVLGDISHLQSLKIFNGKEYKSLQIVSSNAGEGEQYLMKENKRVYGKNTLTFDEICDKKTTIFVN